MLNLDNSVAEIADQGEKEIVAAADDRIKSPPAANRPAERCRLCHNCVTSASLNIYESVADFYNEECRIVDACLELLGVRYNRHEYLPEQICSRCLDLLADFHKQRRSMLEREQELQDDLSSIIKLDPKYRPGLNGNPGDFCAEEGCEIIDVDPDQLCETSDDDFLIGSDMEDEEEESDDEEEAPTEEDADMPLGMDAAQMHTIMQAHQNVDLNTPMNADMHPKSAFLCQYCDLAFTLQPDCQQHELNSHDPAAPYSCNYCQLRLVTRNALISHIKESHDAERPYVCAHAHCSKGFCRRSDLKKHTIVHTGVRPYTCTVCSKSFSRNTNLTKHLRIHNSIKPFVCQQCPRSFQTPLELMKHARSHTEIKPYQCVRCPASFARKDKLQMHQNVHEKRDIEQQQQQQQLVLPLHPYVEADAIQLQQHQQLQSMTMHRPVGLAPKPAFKSSRNYRCDVCEKTFQRERDLQRHRALHMDSLFACKVCGQGFNRREQLQRHELEAHGPNYTCAICNIAFLQQTHLEVHMKVHELQHSVAKSTQEALNATVMAPQAIALAEQPASIVPPKSAQEAQTLQFPMRPSAAEMSFYSNMIPTMNLGFYSETQPAESRNGH
ncbi:oocyte zinc finger protein XlCOF28 [Scaptodrosophila lebanonensis]|uniref:Oocyte zinc finger protein XlCOF28 n=1 Tax=Drosophila lebanonensis TaxID=7225 RepID=A0A6J2UAC3_DROLE|nr:oocyte zinc finger protein XlCOF28 [Scaptodrosophila lebanonensis]